MGCGTKKVENHCTRT